MCSSALFFYYKIGYSLSKDIGGIEAKDMAEVKQAGGNSGSMQPSAAASVMDARIAKKSAQLEAGQVLLTEAARQAAQARQELERERTEREAKKDAEEERQEDKRDTSELSKQSKWFGIEGKLPENVDIRWTLEMMKELWEAFQQWMPVKEQDLSAMLEELSKLYLELLEEVLTHTLGEEQAAQMERLNAVLAEKLNLLLEVDLKDLKQLLEKTGQTDTLNLIKASVYRQATGESISGRAASRFYAQGNTASARSFRYFVPESSGQQAASRSAARGSAYAQTASGVEEGRIYKLADGRRIQMNQAFDAQRKSEELQMSQRGKVSGGNADSAEGKTALTGKELERANLFASHVNGSGNLLKDSGISAQNDEVRGLIAAITNIKGQVYAENAGRNNSMVTPLRNAINQMVDYYLSQKGIYKVYYYTTNAYERTRSPQKAIEEGLEYAYRLFVEKKANETYRAQEAYSDRAGFFQMLLREQTMQADLIKGMRLLENNWREFLRSIGENEKKGIVLKMQKYSPWGILTEPEDLKKGAKEKKDRAILIEAACVAAVALVYICYRLLFG